METLKNILNIVWKFLNSRFFPYILVIIVIMFLARSCQKNGDLEREIKVKDQNELALLDTIKTVRTKNGELNSSIAASIKSEKELKRTNEELYEKLKDQKGKVITLNNAVIRLQQDKAELQRLLSEAESSNGPVQQINDSTYQLPWTLTYRYDSTNYDSFMGITEIYSAYKEGRIVITPSGTWLNKRTSSIDLTFGQKIEDDMLRVFIQSPYPGFSAQSLEGVLIDPNTNPYIKKLIKPKRWFTGLNVGIGTTIGYGLDGRVHLVVGPTLNYGIYSFRK